MNIYIVRHGQTYTNEDNLVCGQLDTKMTKLGHKQVLTTSQKISHIPFDYLYSSSLTRAKETAKYFSDIGNFVFVDDIKEMNTGDYSNLTVNELWNKQSKYKYQGRYLVNKYPNGESLAILYNRIVSWFVQKISYQWQNNKNILIVGHEATIVCAIHYFLQIPLDNYPSFKIPNGCIVKIECDLDENQFRVEFL
jgi:broad specificity phosphatase PhoE